jgi:histidinol phosphatase-like enzyme (inositol monophosphatase family)
VTDPLTGLELFKAALDISGTASQIPLRYFRLALDVEHKADESPVTIADRETEDALRRSIQSRFPAHGIYGEEFGRTQSDSELTWIIDPIDGTKSFISGMPLFGLLLGVLRDGAPEVGIMRMPALGECYAALAGATATRNGEPIRCSRTTRLDDATIYINEANQMITGEPARFERLMKAGRLRRFAYDCYSFALLAGGHIDAVVDYDLKPYDYLPIVPIVEAAGGIMTDWSGRALGLGSDGTVVAAATPEIHRAMLDLLAAG